MELVYTVLHGCLNGQGFAEQNSYQTNVSFISHKLLFQHLPDVAVIQYHST